VALLAQSSFQPIPCMHLMFFPASAPSFCNLRRHGPLTYKRCNKNTLELYGTSTSSCSDKGCGLVSCIFHTIILLVVAGLACLFPYTARMLDIHSCGVLPSCMWCTKRLLIFPCSYSGSTETLGSLDPPLIIQ
jgi:hypothetical protein